MPEGAGLYLLPYWRDFNDRLIELVALVPDDRINWSPKPELWNFRGTLLHIASARDGWLGNTVRDGMGAPSVYETTRSKAEVQREFARTWQRIARFLNVADDLEAKYERVWDDGTKEISDGHWIAFHLLEHDIHHRADILHYLALLDVPVPDRLTV